MKRRDNNKEKERLIKMYIKNLITYEELLHYLEKLDKGSLKEPPTIY